MAILERILQKRAKLNKAVSIFASAGLSNLAASGVPVTDTRAKQYSAVFACQRIIAETVADLPLILYERQQGGGKRRAEEKRLYRLLHDEPNPEMSAFDFYYKLTADAVLSGDGLAWIETAAGEVAALWPMNPRNIDLERINGALWYRYTIGSDDLSKIPGGSSIMLRPSEVLHIMGPTPDGYRGYTMLRVAKEAIGLGIAAEEFGARLFANDARPGGVLEHPEQLGDKAYGRLMKFWKENHQGLSNAHKVAILEEGMKWNSISINPDDAQFLESRKFQITEIARFFRLPPYLLGDLEHGLKANVEQQSMDYLMYSIQPWLKRWKQAVHRSLLFEDERDRYFAEHLVESLLRADIQTRYGAYTQGFQTGILTINEMRGKENMDPVGDPLDPENPANKHFVPLNLIPIDAAGSFGGMGGAGAGDGGNGEAASQRRGRGLRQYRSIIGRTRLAARFNGVFEEAGGRIVRKEVKAIKRAVQKYLGVRAAEGLPAFETWLEEFYKSFPEYIGSHAGGTVRAYADAIQEIVSDEIRIGAGITPELDQFLRAYSEKLAVRHVNESKGQIRGLIAADLEDPGAALIERMDQWDERRPAKIAMRETIKVAGAVSTFLFAANGFSWMWVNTGNKSCPFCEELDGQVIGKGGQFKGAGDVMEGGEGAEPLTISGPKIHAPLHDGCVCQTVAA